VVGLDGKPAGEPAQLCESPRLSCELGGGAGSLKLLCADNLDAYTYESIIVGYFSLFVR